MPYSPLAGGHLARATWKSDSLRGKTDAVGALDIKLTAEDITYLEEFYVAHPIVGAIDKNPAQGVMLLDDKK